MSKATLGDIIEIPVATGLAYAQYTHQHATHGGLIRVFDKIFNDRPGDLSTCAMLPVRFSVFFPVRAAVQRGIVHVAGHADIAPANQAFPLFRSGNPDPKTKRVGVWWLWNGERSWRVGELTTEQRKLDLKEIWNDSMLVQRIEEGWRPENDLG